MTTDTMELVTPATYEDIPKLPRIPLWPGHLYRGTLTMIAGPGGCGKGLNAVHAAAVVTRGALFPGESPDSRPNRIPGSVLGVWPEDDPNEDMAYRLDAALDGAGADLGLVYDMTETEDGEPFDMTGGATESIARMRSVIEALQDCNGHVKPLPCSCGTEKEPVYHEEARWPVLLVIIDPLMAVADSIGTNRMARKTMRPLMKMLKETGVAGLVVHHTVKGDKVIAGSKGLVDVLRLVFTAKKDPLQEDLMVLSVEKSNNLGPIGDLRYKMAGTELEPYITWVESAKTAQRRQPGWRTRDDAQAAAARTLLTAVGK